MTLAIRTGGQTGVDRAALDFARDHRIPYGGWCPKGGWAEDLPRPPGLLARYPDLVETPSTDPRQRSAWNVRDSDATLIYLGGAGIDASPGTAFTLLCAELVFERPVHVVNQGSVHDLTGVIAWLRRLMELHAAPALDLNVAGPRESACPGIYIQSRAWLEELWSRLMTDP